MLDWMLELVGWSAASRFKRGIIRLAVLLAVGAAAGVMVTLLGK
jgi:hypothetical protein